VAVNTVFGIVLELMRTWPLLHKVVVATLPNRDVSHIPMGTLLPGALACIEKAWKGRLVADPSLTSTFPSVERPNPDNVEALTKKGLLALS